MSVTIFLWRRQMPRAGKENEMVPTSPNGTLITVRPIEPGELDRVVLRCWPDQRTIDRLFAKQGTIGMAAWEGDTCVGQLHCYRVMLPDGTNEDWLDYGANWWSGSKVHTEWRKWGPGMTAISIAGPAWCHACCHVGRTLEIFHREIRSLVLRLAPENDWAPARILERLNELNVQRVDLDAVKDILQESRRSGGAETAGGDPDPRYLGRGIGTALCKASIQWARSHGYAAVLAIGAPDGLFEFAAWSGHLPWTTYSKLGFQTVDTGDEEDELPNWAQGDSPPEVMEQVQAALAAGRPAREIRERLMLLDLNRARNSRL